MSVSAFVDVLNHRDRVARARATLALASSIVARPIVSAKFSPHSAVLLHLVDSVMPSTPVVWVDTGYNTRATKAFVGTVSERLGIEPHRFEPHDHVVTVPPALDDPEHARFVEEVKLEPFRRALETLSADAWISSVRREQTTHRRALRAFDEGLPGIVKISPLLEWSEEDLERYAHEHELPVGPDCYDPTKGEPMRECGLHTRLSA